MTETMTNKKSKTQKKANVNRDMIDRLALVAKERRSRSKVSDDNIVDLTNESSQEEASPSVERKLISRTTLPSYVLRFIKDTSRAENRQRLIEKAESVLDVLKRKVLDAPPLDAKAASTTPVQEIKTKTEQRIQCTACT